MRMRFITNREISGPAKLQKSVKVIFAFAITAIACFSLHAQFRLDAQQIAASSLRHSSELVRVAADNVSQHTLEWGIIRPGGTSTRRLQMVNISGLELRVQGTRVSCGCTVPSITPAVIPPGGTAEIELALTVGVEGEKRSRVSVAFEGLPSAGVQLDIQAYVVSELAAKFTHESLTLPSSKNAGDIRTDLLIYNYGPDVWNGISVNFSAPWVHASPPETIQAQREAKYSQAWRLPIFVSSSQAPYSKETVRVAIKANTVRRIETSAKFTVDRVCPIRVVPRALFFGDLVDLDHVQRSITVGYHGDDIHPEISVAVAESLSPFLSFKIAKRSGLPSLWEIDVVLTASAATISANDRYIDIRTSNIGEPALRVPVVYRSKGNAPRANSP